MSQLKEFYEKEAVPELIKAFNYKNIMQVPRLEKIVLNILNPFALLAVLSRNNKIIAAIIPKIGSV